MFEVAKMIVEGITASSHSWSNASSSHLAIDYPRLRLDRVTNGPSRNRQQNRNWNGNCGRNWSWLRRCDWRALKSIKWRQHRHGLVGVEHVMHYFWLHCKRKRACMCACIVLHCGTIDLLNISLKCISKLTHIDIDIVSGYRSVQAASMKTDVYLSEPDYGNLRKVRFIQHLCPLAP